MPKLFINLSLKERLMLLKSIKTIKGNIDTIVKKFYDLLLEDDEMKQLFHNANMMKQHDMFNVSVGILISNIDNAEFVQDHLDKVIDNHRRYGVQTYHVPFFLSTYLSVIQELYKDDPVMEIWKKIITATLTYFEQKI